MFKCILLTVSSTSFVLLLTTSQIKNRYLSLVRSHMTFTLRWRPRLIEGILSVGHVQRRATKYILHDYESSYRLSLVTHHLLSIMYWLELLDMLFLVKCLLDESDTMHILQHVKFISTQIRSKTKTNLAHN